MKTANELQIKTKLNIFSNIQYLIFKNYILSISFENSCVYFYDMKTFKRKFYLKRKRHENKFYHEKWKLFYTKNHKLFLLGYENEKKDGYTMNNSLEKKLDIYILKIGQRKCIKKASFTYYQFIEDENDDKLYIRTDYSIIKYDFITCTSNEKYLAIKAERKKYWEKSFLVDNHFIFVYLHEICKWTFILIYHIIDKNLEYSTECLYFPSICFDLDDYYYSMNIFQQITNNLFSIYSEEIEQKTNIDFIEIRIEEKFLKENDNDKLNDLIFCNKKRINIKETGIRYISLLNKSKCGIAFNYNNYYICNLSNMEIYLKIELIRLNINRDSLLLKFVDGKDKYKLYLSDGSELLYISS